MLSYKKNIEIKYNCDLLITGGGPAGIAASVAAARQGIKVMLIEQNGCLGGMGTTGMVPEFMNFDDGINLLAGGIGGEIKEKLYGSERKYKCYNIEVEKLKRLYDDMLIKNNVNFLFFTKAIDVIKNYDEIEYVVVSSKSGIFAIKAKFYIDCTGDGDLSVMAGAEYEFGDNEGTTMPATLCSYWAGIDFDKRTIPDGAKIGKAYLDKVISQLDLLLPGIKMVDKTAHTGGGNIGHYYKVDAREEKNLTKAMVDSRKIVNEYQEYYRKYIPGCEQAYLCYTANILGIRESRRIVCDYKMVYRNYLERAVFEDEIGRYNYPIDIHPMAADEKHIKEFEKITELKYEKGESYGISLKCLIVKGIDNLFVAGKCISADREMQASMRVMPCCFITGQAAGIAVSVCIDNNSISHLANYKKIQKKLLKMGAHLPNYKE